MSTAVAGIFGHSSSESLSCNECDTTFVERKLVTAGVPRKVISQMNIAVDEVFSNIVRYSGASEVTVCLTVEAEYVLLRFTDNGIPYDPTKKPDPDTGLSAKERDSGGLGFFIVKRSMDSVTYDYQDGLNILTLTKRFNYDV